MIIALILATLLAADCPSPTPSGNPFSLPTPTPVVAPHGNPTPDISCTPPPGMTCPYAGGSPACCQNGYLWMPITWPTPTTTP